MKTETLPHSVRRPPRLMVLTPLLLGLFSLTGDLAAAEIAGWIERAQLMPSGIELKAKLDTGAKNSSINAQGLEFFDVDGVELVRFQVINKAGETMELTEPVVRQASIKRHFGKSQKRPVVLLTVCLGAVRKQVEVNLVNRAGFNYPLLIGRTYLAGDFLIDPGRTYLLQTSCAEEPRP